MVTESNDTTLSNWQDEKEILVAVSINIEFEA